MCASAFAKMVRQAVLPIVLNVAFFTVSAAAPFGGRFEVSEFQPNIPNGGRADTIAVHPTNDNTILVASESGGLFRSTDRGHTWLHVDSLPVIWTRAVAFLPANPDVIIVTAGEIGGGIGLGDFKVAN